MATQARFPGMMPTPAQARAKLKNARAELRVCADTARRYKSDVKNIGAEQTAAEVLLEEAERTMESAVEDSPEQGQAEADQASAWKILCGLEKKAANLKAALVKAESEEKEKRRLLREAREDVQAIREGRRNK